MKGKSQTFPSKVLPFMSILKDCDVSKKGLFIMAIPIYNYNISSSAKNAVELGGRMLYDKIFGFICAAGGKSSYMSVMSLANSLMIDFRCYIIPKFVYATKHDFDGKKISNEEIKERLKELSDELIRITNALGKD